MSPLHAFSAGQGAHKRKSHKPPISGPKLQVQAAHTSPTYPFQPLPAPNGPAPYRYDLSQLLTAADVQQITAAGVMTIHTVGDTGDYRGQQQVFVADDDDPGRARSPSQPEAGIFLSSGRCRFILPATSSATPTIST